MIKTLINIVYHVHSNTNLQGSFGSPQSYHAKKTDTYVVSIIRGRDLFQNSDEGLNRSW